MKIKLKKSRTILKFLPPGTQPGVATVIVIRPSGSSKPALSSESNIRARKGQFHRADRLVATSLLLLTLAASALLVGCNRQGRNALRVGVTPGPAGEILEAVRADLLKQGINLQVISFTDYIQPDLALASHDLDANLYQNAAFLGQFNRDHKTGFVEVTKVYLPLMAIYPGRTKSLDGIKNGARVSVPNDPVNLNRALQLLAHAGLISVSDKSTAITVADIQNPRQLKIVELDAAQLPRSLDEVDLAVINANFALDAGLNPKIGSLFCEDGNSPYANVLSVNAENRNDPRIQSLAAALNSQPIREFIAKRYKGAINPAL